MSKNTVLLDELMVHGQRSLDPRNSPNEEFELYSIPAYDKREPEQVLGNEVGSSKKIVEPGDLLLSRIVPHIRRAWVVPSASGKRQIASGEWIVFRHDLLEPRYLRHYVMGDTFHSQFMNTVAGVGGSLVRARPENVGRIEVPLPPLSEQKRIADILDKADSIRRKRQEAMNILENSKVAAFYEIFSDPIQNTKHWARQPLGELLECIDSGISPRCLDRPVFSGEWGILKLGAVTWCEYDWTQNKALPDAIAPDPSIEIKQGDLLFTRKNTYELVAATAFVYQTPPQLMLPDLIFRLRLRSEAPVLSEYLWGLLTYPSKRKQVQTLAGGAAGSMPNISKTKLLQQLVEVPPMRFQESYVEFLHQVHKTRHSAETSKNASDNLFHSLVQRAFKGQL